MYDAEKSQTDINFDEENSLTFLTSKLDSMYSAVIVEYQDQEIFIKNFKKSQVVWKQYMESQLLARFPEDEEYRGGSSFGMCYALYKQQLIKERISSVNDWLIGFPEGEICGGSVKVKGYWIFILSENAERTSLQFVVIHPFLFCEPVSRKKGGRQQ